MRRLPLRLSPSLLFLIAWSLVAANDFPEPMIGRVAEVTPNNGLIVIFDTGERRQVVLANISIPYGDQPYASRANEILRAQLLDRRVNVRQVHQPRDGQDYIPALVYVGKHNVNVDLVRRGHAWINPLEAPHPVWTRMQSEAQKAGRGLWATDFPQHPSDYRLDQVHRANFENTLTEIATSEVMVRLRSTLIGIRDLKVYMPITCARWASFRQAQHVIFTTPASAEAAGYALRGCDDLSWTEEADETEPSP